MYIGFKKLTLCIDMYGCPNRCRHCWVGHSANGNLSVDDFRQIAEQFRQYANEIEMFDWYREPDFNDNYKELWKLCAELSDSITPHFELISIWRLVRDSDYVKWLVSLGLEKAQLTLFGGETATDFYTGRKGAYKEILRAIDILIDNKISPRIQVFVNKNNIDELPLIERLIIDKRLEERCADFGGEFTCFVHQGSCDGENAKLYDVRVTQEDLKKIPPLLTEYTLKHFGAQNLHKVFGETEQKLYQQLITVFSTESYVTDSPVFYIDSKLDVYPNISTPVSYWSLGNLKESGAGNILRNYLQSKSAAQTARLQVPICEIVKAVGNPQSQRLFNEQDYIVYLLNRFCELNYN